jgi:hypothetical protein
LAVLVVLLGAALAGCAPKGAGTDIIYADATRGCKDAEGPVALWSEPGAAPAGAEIVAEVPHGTQFTVLDRAARFGVPYYRVEYEGTVGWLPANYSETIAPVCS